MTSAKRCRDEYRERAYMAASRRADRSVKARVDSALKASQVHKKRTGKSLRITEDIVMSEEPYEEEQDSSPPSYKPLQSRLWSVPPKLGIKVEAISSESTTSAILAKTEEEWRESEINRLFAQAFPNFGQQSQQPWGYKPWVDLLRRKPGVQSSQEPSQLQQGEDSMHGSAPPESSGSNGGVTLHVRESLLGETTPGTGETQLSDSGTTRSNSCSLSSIADLPPESMMFPKIPYSNNSYDSQNLRSQDCVNLGEDVSFEADHLGKMDDIGDWPQYECGSGDITALVNWDSQLMDDTMEEWWSMLVDDGALASGIWSGSL